MFIVHMPQLPMIDPELLLKIAGHPEDRLRERTALPVEALDPIRRGAARAMLPPGSHHVPLQDGSYAVLKDISKRGGQPRHVLATVLGPSMNPPGYDVTREVIDIDPDDVQVVSFSEGDKQKRGDTLKAKERRGPNSHSFEVSRTHHSVKVAAYDDEDTRARLRALRHDAETAQKYARIMQRENRYLSPDPSQLPQREPPSNDSDTTEREIQTILQTMRDEPLPEEFVLQASQSVLKTAYIVCDHLGVDRREEIASEFARDALYIAMFLKYHYLRPRPYQIAPYFDGDIDSLDHAAEQTPSYPSGHGLMGFTLARLYAKLYPEHAEAFTRFGEDIGLSRIQAGVHYPSDIEYAREIVDALMGSPEPLKKESSVIGATFGALQGDTLDERAAGAAGGALGGLVGNAVGLTAGLALSKNRNFRLRGMGTSALVGHTAGAVAGGAFGGMVGVQAHRRYQEVKRSLKAEKVKGSSLLRSRTPNLDRKARKP